MPQFFDEDALARELKKRISEVFKAPDAKKVLAFTQAQRDSIVAGTQVMLNATVSKVCELFDAHKARIDGVMKQTDKHELQLGSFERRLSRHSEHLNSLESRLKALERK